MKDKAKMLNAVRLRKARHIKKRFSGTPERPRLVVFRSSKHIYAQLVDDVNNVTLVSSSTLKKSLREKIDNNNPPIEKSKMVGQDIADGAKSKNIRKVVFDRNGYLYHGRVQAVADGARAGGLDF